MAMAPNNPFQDPQNDQGYAQGPAPRKGGKGCLIGCIIAGVLGMFVCCGGGVFMMYAALEVLGSEYERQLANNPVIIEKVGEIESFDFSFSGTVEEGQSAENQGGDTPLAFEVKGSKSSARVLIVQEQGGNGAGMQSAILVMPDGSRIPLDTEAGSIDGEDLDLDLDLDEMFDSGDLDLGDAASPPPAESETSPAQETTP